MNRKKKWRGDCNALTLFACLLEWNKDGRKKKSGNGIKRERKGRRPRIKGDKYTYSLRDLRSTYCFLAFILILSQMHTYDTTRHAKYQKGILVG